VQVARNKFDKALVHLKGLEDDSMVSYHSRRMVEMATDLIMSYLLLRDAIHSERKLKIAETFIEKMGTRTTMSSEFIVDGDSSLLRNYKEIVG
jgi:3-(methylthio)propanoyl-CoA dehydrogenase